MDEKVCLCRGISATRIIDSIKKGAHTVEAVKEATGATQGGCCGFRCKDKIEELIEENK
ncbi:MAG: (2Fe-2S)-binding protein [Sarcina sp.]